MADDANAYQADPTWIAAQAALQKALKGYQDQTAQQEASYDADYKTGLHSLGYQGSGWDPNKGYAKGTWAANDPTTSYGNSYNNQLNDFAGRDMLNSTFYSDALNNMNRKFSDQLNSMATARTNARTTAQQTLGQESSENDLAQQQARAEAIARLAATATTY